MIPLSVLDLSPIVEGGSAASSFSNTLDLARNVERWGYQRFWLAEHHNMPGIASAATALVISHVAAGTERIRVGAGGIMLPNHAPLVVAEQFGTLETLYPGRIDLGLGRAPGTDPAASRALRRNLMADVSQFPSDVRELMAFFEPAQSGELVRAVPGAGLNVPIWILGSSTFGAELAAELGLPYAFASHFAPAQLMPALELYRRHFRPSAQLSKPHVMVAVNVVAADTSARARHLLTSLQQAFINLRRGRPSPLPPPVQEEQLQLTPMERLMLDEVLSYSAVGSPPEVASTLRAFVQRTRADELIINSMIHDHAARLRSYELTAQVWQAFTSDTSQSSGEMA